ncbi:MAG: energy transducer TonB [Flavobacteriales bacterium]|nr:energy transducer TonB [Flavobacteriales bacterium]
MENKKSEKVNLENKRVSILLLGMVCATSTVLMSFEYANFELNNQQDLVGLTNSNEEDIWVMEDIKMELSSAPQQELPKVIEYVEPTPIEPIDPIDPGDPIDPIDPWVLPLPGDGFGEGFGQERVLVIDSIEPVLPVADVMPEFPGGLEEMYKFMAKNIKYPEGCKSNGIQGKTYVQFTVEKDGSITDVSIAQSKHKLFSLESERVVNLMPKWTPGKVNGKPVRVRYTLPVNYILD